MQKKTTHTQKSYKNKHIKKFKNEKPQEQQANKTKNLIIILIKLINFKICY